MKPRTMWGAHGPIPIVAPDVLPFVDENGRALNGQYDVDGRRILVEPTITGFLRHETIEHEWVHSVLSECGSDQVISEAQNEWVATVLGKALASRLHTHTT
jgi:hypothetical protein